MKVEMEVFRAQARGNIVLEAPTVQAAKDRAVVMVNAREVPLEPVEDGVAVRVVKITGMAR